MEPTNAPYIGSRISAINALPIVMSVATAATTFGLVIIALVMLRPILPIDETRYFSVAWEMWNGGSAIVPHLNGAAYSDKPPLLFWLINAAWELFGTNSPAARFVAPFFAVACIFLTARLARRLWPQDQSGGAMAAWILATTGTFLLFGSLTMFDTMLATATLLAILGILRARQQPAWYSWPAVGAAIGFGVLAKGPVILLHVLPVALLMPFWAERTNRPALRGWYRGIGLAMLYALALVSIWLVPALITGGSDYRYDILWRQHGGRMVASFAHEQPAWFYVALLPLITWPWAWSRQFLRELRPQRLLHDEGLRFCLTWLLASVLLFSLVSGKQIHYLLPEMSALALIVGNAIYARMPDSRRADTSRPLAALVIPVVLFLTIVVSGTDWLVPAMAEKGLEVTWTAALAAGAILALLVGVVFWRSAGITGWLLLAPATLLMVHVLLSPVLYHVYDARNIGARLAGYEESGIAMLQDEYRGEFTFAGRLTRPVEELPDDTALWRWSATHPGGVVVSRHAIPGPSFLSLGTYNFRGRGYQLYEVPDLECTPLDAMGISQYE